MVEFALILFPLIMLVGGIIQFGIGLELLARHQPDRERRRALRINQRLARVPCVAQSTCIGTPACNAAPAALVGRSLANYLKCEVVKAGLPPSVGVIISARPVSRVLDSLSR